MNNWHVDEKGFKGLLSKIHLIFKKNIVQKIYHLCKKIDLLKDYDMQVIPK